MSKLKAVLFWCLKAVLFSTILALLVAIFGHRSMIDAIYKNVEDIMDGEMPPTVVSFQSGPEIVSTIGGSGEGLNCSLPPGLDIFFDSSMDASGKRHLVRQRFRQACVFHDLCYRHGLATYGYNQNDCDRVLQNQAFRLCLYVRNDGPQKDVSDAERNARNAERCQTDSKMILAGVSLGGHKPYRAWDRSTFFEFESDPSRSNGFSAARVVDHPFKFIEGLKAKYAGESDQIILTFVNNRSNLTVTCATCQDLVLQKWTRLPEEASDEMKSAGIASLPQALLTNQDLKLSATGPVWLPPRRRHGAPHLLIDTAGKNHLIWVSRNNPENTISCIVVADAARLLTNTLPQRDFCNEGARSPLKMVEVDMFSTSPLPMEIPGAPAEDGIVAVGLSAQRLSAQKKADHSLSFCAKSAIKPVNRSIQNDDQANCVAFPNEETSSGKGLGAFQNFAVVRPGQQIFVARDMRPSESRSKYLWQRIGGDAYSTRGVMLIVDATAPTAPKLGMVRFDIPDLFDPMMPISRTKDDLRFLSLRTSEEKVGVHVIDFAKNDPGVEDVNLNMSGTNIRLDKSWAFRPVQVLETRGASPKTKLVFSRGKIAVEPGKPVDPNANVETVRLETLVLERDAAAPPDKPFLVTGGASCAVKYTFKLNHDYPCHRTFDPNRPMRSSPAAKMQASQLLIGHFAGDDGHGIAFPDACLKEPIVLKPTGGAGGFAPAKQTAGVKSNIERDVVCNPIGAIEYVAGAMDAETSRN
jgi:hypothetical protein